MDKMVFLFPGVGSQYNGMGKVFYDRFAVFRDTFTEAGDALGMDLAALCYDAPAPQLARVENAQLAILTMSTAFFKVYMQEIGITPQFCMGHSLGEYSALCAAGVLSFPQALELVRQRGEIIKEVSAALDGTMMWVINLDVEKVEEICGAVCAPGNEVYVSAYDSPTQASISGRSAAVKTAARQMEQAGAIVYPLKFTGPYHSPLMAEAAARMAEVLGEYRFAEPKYPVIANRTARPYEGKSSVAQNLAQQLVSPINWRNSIAYVLEQGVKIAAEIGPKDVLKFLAKKNSDRLDAFAVDKDEDWDLLKQRLLIPQEEYVQVIGRCLGAAVSTRNKNPKSEKYEDEVIRPYNRMASFYERLLQSGELPTSRQAEEALRILRAVFQAKQVAPQEQEKKFARILRGRRLSPHFDISAE